MRSKQNLPLVRRRRYLLLGAALALTLQACGGASDEGSVVTVDGVRVKTTINKNGSYDIDITGGDCEVTVATGNVVKRLRITGVSNKVSVQPTAQIDLIDFVGHGNTVYVPKGFKTRVLNSGGNNDVIER